MSRQNVGALFVRVFRSANFRVLGAPRPPARVQDRLQELHSPKEASLSFKLLAGLDSLGRGEMRLF